MKEIWHLKTKQNKTKQNKTKQKTNQNKQTNKQTNKQANKTKQKTKQNETKTKTNGIWTENGFSCKTIKNAKLVIFGFLLTVVLTLVYQRGDYQPLKGRGKGPWLVLVSLCFMENVVATRKIGSFLCSLDNLLQKNVIFLFFGKQISKWRSFEKKRAIFDLLFTFFKSPGKSYKNSFSTYLTHIHTRILLTLLTFLP